MKREEEMTKEQMMVTGLVGASTSALAAMMYIIYNVIAST